MPQVLRPLFAWNVRRVTENGWENDSRRLIGEIAAASRLPVGPDLDTLLRDAGTARQRSAEMKQVRHLQAGQVDALRRTVEELTHKLAEASASERPRFGVAFAALAQDRLCGGSALGRATRRYRSGRYPVAARPRRQPRENRRRAGRPGDGRGALVAYRQALGIREALAARDPANTQWQRDLAASHEKIGDVLVAQGGGRGALAAYRQAFAIREPLAARGVADRLAADRDRTRVTAARATPATSARPPRVRWLIAPGSPCSRAR